MNVSNELIRPLSFSELGQYSPWPKRLFGLDTWKKSDRSQESILEEYNDHWYKKALNLWEASFEVSNENVRPLRFYQAFDNVIQQEMNDNPKIYQLPNGMLPISIDHQLFLCNSSLISPLYVNLIIDTINQLVTKNNIKTVIETGCGTGINLFNIFEKTPITNFIGGEICSNAIELGNRIAKKCLINGVFQKFNYYEQNSLIDLLKNTDKKYLLFTSHSIEQINFEQTTFVDQLLSLRNKPEIIIHFEPIIDQEGSTVMDHLSQIYSTINCYNNNLLSVLKQYENDKIIEIIEYKKQVFGLNAFNPTSILAWKFRT